MATIWINPLQRDFRGDYQEKGFRLVFYDKRGAVVTDSTSVINGKKLANFLKV